MEGIVSQNEIAVIDMFGSLSNTNGIFIFDQLINTLIRFCGIVLMKSDTQFKYYTDEKNDNSTHKVLELLKLHVIFRYNTPIIRRNWFIIIKAIYIDYKCRYSLHVKYKKMLAKNIV